MNTKKSQSAFEYLIVLGIIMALILPGVYLFYTKTQSASDQVSLEKLSQMGAELVKNIEYVYPFGDGTKNTIDFNLPLAINNITINGDPAVSTGTEIVISFSFESTNVSLVYFSKFPAFIGNCTKVKPLPINFLNNPGLKTFQIISCGANISVYQKE